MRTGHARIVVSLMPSPIPAATPATTSSRAREPSSRNAAADTTEAATRSFWAVVAS